MPRSGRREHAFAMGSTGTSPIQPLLRADRPTRDKDAQAERALEDRLRTFRPIQGWTLRSATRVMPWMVLACVAALLIAGDRDPMFISALVAAAVAGFLFQVLMRELPEVLQELWNREVLKPDQRGGPSNRPDRSDAQALEGLARIQIQMNQTRRDHAGPVESSARSGAAPPWNLASPLRFRAGEKLRTDISGLPRQPRTPAQQHVELGLRSGHRRCLFHVVRRPVLKRI